MRPAPSGRFSLFMRGIMAIKPRLEKPLIFKCHHTHEERASMLVSESLRGRDCGALWPTQRDAALTSSLMTATCSPADLTASPIGDGATSVISGSRRTGGVKVSDAGCWRRPRWKPARGSASASTSIHSIQGRHTSMSDVVFCVLARSMIFRPDMHGSRAEVGQLVVFPVTPDVLHRVEFRGVTRQVVERQAAGAARRTNSPDQAAAMSLAAVRITNSFARQMTQQVAEEVHHLRGADGCGIEPEVKAGPGDARLGADSTFQLK